MNEQQHILDHRLHWTVDIRADPDAGGNQYQAKLQGAVPNWLRLDARYPGVGLTPMGAVRNLLDRLEHTTLRYAMGAMWEAAALYEPPPDDALRAEIDTPDRRTIVEIDKTTFDELVRIGREKGWVE